MAMTPDQEYVLKTIKGRDISFVRFWFVDVMGNMKSFAVSPNEMENAFTEGVGFDGSCIDGFTSVACSDMLAFPEASTFQILPWRPNQDAVARMFCTIRTPEGERFKADPRFILSRLVAKIEELGYECIVRPELEYYYFKDATAPVPLDKGGYFDLMSLDSAVDLRRDTVLALEHMGIPVEYSHHEEGPSQNEVDLRESDVASMADAIMTYKLVVKEIAAKHGVYASFMPKPLSNCPGNGLHLNISLFDEDGNNVFYDEKDPLGYCLSKRAKCFIAGLLKYAPEFSLITNQYVNSYKRLIGGFSVPYSLNWGRSNRSTLVRVPAFRDARSPMNCLELRNADPACNPYLALAAVLAAGLKGIVDELPLSKPVDETDLTTMSIQDFQAAGMKLLPRHLGEAIELFASSTLMKDVLGEHIHSHLVQQKRAEWNEYLGQVSEWELKRYLERL